MGSVYSNQYVQLIVQNDGRAKNAPECKRDLPVKEFCLYKVYQQFHLFVNLSYMQPLTFSFKYLLTTSVTCPVWSQHYRKFRTISDFRLNCNKKTDDLVFHYAVSERITDSMLKN